MPPLDIAIIGYGSAGQALGLLLARDGHRVQIYEQAAQPGPVGAGFLLQPTGLAALWSMGLLDAAMAHGRVVKRLYGENERGRVVMDMRYRELDRRFFGLGLQRGALFETLHAAMPASVQLHCGRRIASADTGSGWIEDAQGRREGPFDLLIAADGSASQLRGQLPAEQRRLDQPYPWGALWCLLPESGWHWCDELRQRYRKARQMIGMLPVGGRPSNPQPMLSFFWSLRCGEFSAWESMPLEQWRSELRQLWPELGQHAELLTAHGQLARASYRDVILAKRWHHQRLVLAGDSAHAMSPQLGQGVNMALLDALGLARALREHTALPEALNAYAGTRSRHVAAYQFWSRWLTPVFQSERDLIAGLRDQLLHPLGRIPGGRGNMLRILTGTRSGWIGLQPLPPGFVQALEQYGRERRRT